MKKQEQFSFKQYLFHYKVFAGKGILLSMFPHNQSRKANIIILRLMKRVGGHWVVGDPDYGQHRAVDGDKFVCLDQILEQDQCVIYSFGISSDWTFEDQMDELGTFTHTIWV